MLLLWHPGRESGAGGEVIRNFSLRNWRKWTRRELEAGELPEEMRAEAQQAVRQAEQASAALAAGRLEPPAALLAAMEAREAYDEAYRRAYREQYVAEIVAELWREDVRRMVRRRKAAVLLLH